MVSRSGIVHFLIASKVDRYRAFNNAVSLGKTLFWRLSLRYVVWDADTIETQAKDKDAALKLMKGLPSLYNQTNKGERNKIRK